MLDVDISLMLMVAIVFLVLVVLLNSWLYQPLMRFMDERDRSIHQDMESVSTNKEEIEALEAKSEAIIAQAKSEAAAMRAKVVEESKALAESKIEATKKELMEAQEVFEAELSKEEAQLRNALLSQLPLFKESLKAKFSTI